MKYPWICWEIGWGERGDVTLLALTPFHSTLLDRYFKDDVNGFSSS
jgi:hypothetical protein